MILNVPQIDWITFTSWEKRVFDRWTYWQSLQTGDCKEGKIKMYSGFWTGSAFIGQGDQGTKKHYIARVSGESSHNAFDDLQDVQAKVTRIDVQITIPFPDGYSARNFADQLRFGDWGKFGREVQLIENTDFLDTVYIGSRKSDRFARIYVKAANGEKFLRLEVEYKGSWAEAIGNAYFYDKSMISGFLLDFIETLPMDDQNGVIKAFKDVIIGSRAGIINPKKIPDDDATWNWLMDQTMPVIWRYLNNHDRCQYLANTLVNMISQSSAFDTGNDNE